MAYLLELDDGGGTDLVAKGAIIKRPMVYKGQMLLVPSGWIMVELACPEGLCYGLRQSFYRITPSIMGHLLQYYKQSAKGQTFIERLERVHEHASA